MGLLNGFGLWLAVMLGMGSPAHAQTSAPRVVTCDTATVPQSALRVEDEASAAGVLIEDPALIMLPNGMRAVQFSVRHIRPPDPFNAILKVRYTVRWTDDCGRRLLVGGNTVDGLALNPQRQEIIQSTAMHPDATHAVLRIYVEN